jgi:hypothetical protein
MRPHPPLKSRPIDPLFRADGGVLAVSAAKDGNLRVVYSGKALLRARWRPGAGEKMRWPPLMWGLDPFFRADSVVLAISVEKDGNLRAVYARIGRCQGRPAWRGAQAAVARPYPAVTCHVGVHGGAPPSYA